VPGYEWDVIDFSELYRTHAGDVHRFVLFLSGDPALADDILSETFIRLWHARDRVDLTTVKGYLLAIARNLFLADRRHARRMTTLDERAPDTRPGPERRAHAHLGLAAVLAALQTLPEIDRAAVLLRAEGMSYDEVAAALGISPVAARVKVRRARLKLAEAMRIGGPGIAEPEWDDDHGPFDPGRASHRNRVVGNGGDHVDLAREDPAPVTSLGTVKATINRLHRGPSTIDNHVRRNPRPWRQ
jgi:RNA polymerase sigma-70 factor (ECF subfamily)